MLSANQGTHRRGAAFVRLLAEATWRIAGETNKAHNTMNEMGMRKQKQGPFKIAALHFMQPTWAIE